MQRILVMQQLHIVTSKTVSKNAVFRGRRILTFNLKTTTTNNGDQPNNLRLQSISNRRIPYRIALLEILPSIVTESDHPTVAQHGQTHIHNRHSHQTPQ